MITGRAIIECPYCHKVCVSVFHKPSYLQGRKSSISNKSTMKYYRVPESYQVAGDCPNCRKRQNEVQKAVDGEPLTRLSHEQRIKRLKEAGLPTVVGQ